MFFAFLVWGFFHRRPVERHMTSLGDYPSEPSSNPSSKHPNPPDICSFRHLSPLWADRKSQQTDSSRTTNQYFNKLLLYIPSRIWIPKGTFHNLPRLFLLYSHRNCFDSVWFLSSCTRMVCPWYWISSLIRKRGLFWLIGAHV